MPYALVFAFYAFTPNTLVTLHTFDTYNSCMAIAQSIKVDRRVGKISCIKRGSK